MRFRPSMSQGMDFPMTFSCAVTPNGGRASFHLTGCGLADEIAPPPGLIRAGLDALPAMVRAQGERASCRFIEFFTASIPNRNTRSLCPCGKTLII
jgi:hypothetical protein